MNTDQPNTLRLLAATRFAEGLTNEQLQCICRASRVMRLPRGATLFQEGSQEDEVFVISSGRISLAMQVPHRDSVRLMTAEPGDLVGWSGLISDGRMTATAIAAEDTTLIAMSGRKLRILCEDDSKLGYHLMLSVARVLAQRILATRLQMMDLFSQTHLKS